MELKIPYEKPIELIVFLALFLSKEHHYLEESAEKSPNRSISTYILDFVIGSEERAIAKEMIKEDFDDRKVLPEKEKPLSFYTAFFENEEVIEQMWRDEKKTKTKVKNQTIKIPYKDPVDIRTYLALYLAREIYYQEYKLSDMEPHPIPQRATDIIDTVLEIEADEIIEKHFDDRKTHPDSEKSLSFYSAYHWYISYCEQVDFYSDMTDSRSY